MTCSSIFFDAEEKHKNTQNTKGVVLCICPFVAEEKHKNTQNTKRVAPVLFGPHHTLTTKPKKYKKNKPNKTSPQYCLLAHLHQGVKKYKNTQWLTIFFSRICGKKTQNYIKHKRHIWSFSTLQRAISMVMCHHLVSLIIFSYFKILRI